MIEHYITYNVETGQAVAPGSGTYEGVAADQRYPEGLPLAALKVPFEALLSWPPDLAAIKYDQAAVVGAKAELVRQRFITPGSGKAMSYQAKVDEARVVTADAGASTPILAAEAAVRGTTVAALAAEVLALRQAWQIAEARINAAEMGAKVGIEAATNIAALVAAAAVDWDGLAT